MLLLIGTLIGAVLFGVIVRIVAHFNLGLEVDGLPTALVCGLLIAAISQFIIQLIPWSQAIVGALVSFVTTIVVVTMGHCTLERVHLTDVTGVLLPALLIALAQFDLLFLANYIGRPLT